MAAIVTLTVRTRARAELVDVTSEVAEAVRKSGVRDGLAVIFSSHTTAGITVQENTDPDLREDVLDQLATLVPQHPRFRHGEGNADAHIKATIVGSSVTVIIEGGALHLGTWQAIYFAEFDGPRTRKLEVKVLAG